MNDFVESSSASKALLPVTMQRLYCGAIHSAWHEYQEDRNAEHGYTPWWRLFDMLAELRSWGPEDRLSADDRTELENRLPFDDEAEVRLELEHWPTRNLEKLGRWRRETEARVAALGGRVIDRSAIHEGSFVYDAMLVGLTAGSVRAMPDNPSTLDGLAILDGFQFVLPQTIAQSLPAHSQPTDVDQEDLENFDPTSPFRALLFDGTPVAGHRSLDGGVAIEDVHDLVARSLLNAAARSLKQAVPMRGLNLHAMTLRC